MEEKINILSRVDLGFVIKKEVDLNLAENTQELKKIIFKEVFKKIKKGEIGKVDFEIKKYV